MEADDDRARRLGEQNIPFGDGADPALNDLDLDLGVGQVRKRVGEGLCRTALVGLDEQFEGASFARGRMRHEIFERHGAFGVAPASGLAIETFSPLRNFACFGAVFDHEELVAGHRHADHAKHLHRNRGAGFLDRFPSFVEHRADATREEATNEVVANLEGAALHEHRRHGALARVELRLDNRAGGAPIRVGLEVQDLGLQKNLVEQRPDVGALLGGDLGVQRLTAELFEDHAVAQQFLLDLERVGRGQVDLVDRDDDRHAGILRVRNRLDGLRHDGIVRSHNEHDDVRHLGAAGTHGRERLVAGRVEERDHLAARCRHMIRADVLRNATGFTGDDIGFADVVEQRCLAMVDVAHDRDHRWPRPERLRRVGRCF